MKQCIIQSRGEHKSDKLAGHPQGHEARVAAGEPSAEQVKNPEHAAATAKSPVGAGTVGEGNVSNR